MLAPSVQHLPGLSMELVELWAMLCLLWSGHPVWHKVEMTMSKKKKRKENANFVPRWLQRGGGSCMGPSQATRTCTNHPCPPGQRPPFMPVCVVESRENCEILNQDVSGVLGLLGRAPSHVARFWQHSFHFRRLKNFPVCHSIILSKASKNEINVSVSVIFFCQESEKPQESTFDLCSALTSLKSKRLFT